MTNKPQAGLKKWSIVYYSFFILLSVTAAVCAQILAQDNGSALLLWLPIGTVTWLVIDATRRKLAFRQLSVGYRIVLIVFSAVFIVTLALTIIIVLIQLTAASVIVQTLQGMTF